MKGINNDINRNFEALENKVEYQESQSRRNNIKIFGVPEEENEKTWEDTEVIVKTLIRNKLGIEEHIEIEQAHHLTCDDRGEDETPPKEMSAMLNLPHQRETHSLGPLWQRLNRGKRKIQ